MRTSASRVMPLAGDVLDELAVPQHRDAVADVHRLFQRMGNENDAGAALLQRAEQMEEMLHFFRRERRGRFVEDEDPGVVPHRTHDLDHLSLGGAEIFHQRQRIDIEVHRLQRLGRGDIDLAVDGEELLHPEFEVLRDGHRGHQAGFLIDHRDAALQRLLWRLELDLVAVDQIVARRQRDRAGDRLAQRRFSGAVFAEQGVDFACAQFEIHAVDGMQSAVDLAALDDLKQRRFAVVLRLHRHQTSFAPLAVGGNSTRQLRPFDTASTCAPTGLTAVTPWIRPSTRLCRLSVASPSPLRRATRP